MQRRATKKKKFQENENVELLSKDKKKVRQRGKRSSERKQKGIREDAREAIFRTPRSSKQIVTREKAEERRGGGDENDDPPDVLLKTVNPSSIKVGTYKQVICWVN